MHTRDLCCSGGCCGWCVWTFVPLLTQQLPPARPGYGLTCVLEDGDVLEKAAANITVVNGTLTPQRAQAMSSRGRSVIDPAGGQAYSAAAMSLVFHCRHPFVPTLRADVRLFQVSQPADEPQTQGMRRPLLDGREGARD